MTESNRTCLIHQSACGRIVGEPVCTKCGLDERVRYVSEDAALLATSKAEAQYWKSHALTLQARLKQRSSAEPDPQQKAAKPYDVGQTFQDLLTAPQMVVLPRGRFLMGLADDEFRAQLKKEADEEQAANDQSLSSGEPWPFARSASEPISKVSPAVNVEGPQHLVSIDYHLAIGIFPVTFAQWDACVADGGVNLVPDDEGWGRGDRPVINVSWEDAQKYIAWLNKKLGLNDDTQPRYCLPSEAEWEYACRAGSTGQFNTASGFITPDDANYDASYDPEGRQPVDGEAPDSTMPVGSYPPNHWGLFDMHGNVSEWVQDSYEERYHGAPNDGSPRENNAETRVHRGGSWQEYADAIGSTARFDAYPDDAFPMLGFRLAKTTRPFSNAATTVKTKKPSVPSWAFPVGNRP